MATKKPFYSFIIPVFNEAGNVASLHKEIKAVGKKLKKPFEIIAVNDGSNDATLKILKTLSPVKIINFRKNFGQSAALDAGIKHAQGEILITMDGDGQNDPTDAPKMLDKLNKGYDVVCGWRYHRQDPFSKRFISDGAKFLKKYFVNDGVHDSGCTLRVYRRECFDHLDLYGEMHRMIPALLRWNGFRITEIKVNHRRRKSGQSKYDWKRTFKGFLDMLDVWFWRKYKNRPLHLFGSAGLVFLFFSIVLGAYLLIKRLFFGYGLADKIWPLIAVTGFITGIQLLVFGLLANLILKSGNNHNDFYKIKSIIEEK